MKKLVKKLNMLSIMTLLVVSVGMITPAVSAEKTNSQHTKSNKKAPITQNGESPIEQTDPRYPKKYTPEYISQIKDTYKTVGKDEAIYVALDMLKGTGGEFSREAILGNNLTGKPVKVEFKDLGSINQQYQSFDALGWKKGSRLYIYINQKHTDAPAMALAALLSHEALHQDAYNSLSEETYAWTMEAAVWSELTELHPDFVDNFQPLTKREDTLKQLFEKGNYTDKYIKKTVYSNPGYKDLPETSPGFEAL